MKWFAATLGIVTLMLVPDDARTATSQLSDTTRQKAALLQRLLNDSPLSKRVAADGSPAARSLLEQATNRAVLAERLLQSGDIAKADAALNEAMTMVNRAGQVAPDMSHFSHEQWMRHGRLLASVESLQASIRRHLSDQGYAANEAPWQKEFDSLLQRARTLAAADQVLDANVVLVQAEAALLAAFRSSYRTNTVDYSPRFRDANDEFEFELARNASYLRLVPLAVTELNPPLAAVQTIDGHMTRARRARERAERLAAERSFEAALRLIRDASAELQLALAAAGLNVPKEIRQ